MSEKTKKQSKLFIKTGDTVMVIAGNAKGKKGKVLEIYPSRSKAIVEGLNLITKHVKPSAENTQGGRTQQEAPIHISNLMLVDPATGEPTRVGRKQDDNGKLQRYSKKTGKFISNG
jgi:large subunit ribosomal protein L24